jgi:hypothetical protein
MAGKINTSAGNQELANTIQELLMDAMYLEKNSATKEAFHITVKELVRLHEDILKNGGPERLHDILDFFYSDLKLYYDYLMVEFSDDYQM